MVKSNQNQICRLTEKGGMHNQICMLHVREVEEVTQRRARYAPTMCTSFTCSLPLQASLWHPRNNWLDKLTSLANGKHGEVLCLKVLGLAGIVI